jgi:uncharacterized membrane protein
MAPIRDIVDSWASFYASSPVARSAVTFTHVGALVVGGGSAIAADLGTVRAFRRDAPAFRAELERLHSTHRLVTTSLGLVVLSGILLMLADFDAYVASTAFWTKMGLFGALVLNGALIVSLTTAAREDSPRDRARLRLAALASLLLWMVTTLLGTVVPNAL